MNKAKESEHWLGELLAVIHCDGGHYQSEHGVIKATQDAISKRSAMVVEIDSLKAKVERLTDIGGRLARLLKDSYWAQTPLDVATIADGLLSALTEFEAGKTEKEEKGKDGSIT